MKRTLTTIAVTLLGVAGLALMPAAPSAASSHSHATHGHAGHDTAQMNNKRVSTPVEIIAVAPDGTSIEVDHPPIPQLGWPAMQMSLNLADPALAEGLAAGDKATVEIEQLSATEYVISKIKKD
ncbi:MAG: copper-binding protein [Desulforhopalus sp.]|jgi:Cu/Ag efflux protein CusF|nr:copper-binding protein [Desulforhopalus sp.]